jgi:sporulation protein YlmC with PRC-barrel domain
MAIVLKPKKSETASSVPTTSDLAVGEICMNVVDRKIYTRKSDNSIVVVGSHVDASVGGDVTGTVSNIQIAANTVGITELNVSDGSAGQYLTTNGSGTLSFATDSTNVTGTSVGGDLSGTVGNAQIATNTVGITELNVSDGTNGQVLKTNGSGTLSFTDSGATLQQATSKAVTMAIALG